MCSNFFYIFIVFNSVFYMHIYTQDTLLFAKEYLPNISVNDFKKCVNFVLIYASLFCKNTNLPYHYFFLI